MNPLLHVESLSKRYPVAAPGGAPLRLFGRGARTRSWLHAVDKVSFQLHAGESMGLVGESGCGKSTLVRLITRLVDPTEGRIRFHDRYIGDVPTNEFAALPDRAQIQQVFQDPTDSLNPHFTAFDCIADPLRRLGHWQHADHRPLPAAEIRRRVERTADQVSLPRALLSRYPHQLSGGQKLRVGIARGIVLRPSLLILDEPTSALDVSVQAVILHLLAQLRRELGLTYLFVSHDLNVVRLLCDRVMVMYLGRVIEQGPAATVLRQPQHPYTQALLAAASSFDPGGSSRRIRLTEEPQSPIDPDPRRCRFYSRCRYRKDACRLILPELQPLGAGEVACLSPVGTPAAGAAPAPQEESAIA